jgi:hypothetical protein
MRIKIHLHVLALLLVLTACEKEPIKQTEKPIDTFADSSFLVCNEGNFMWGNASVSLYNASTNQVNVDVFKQANGVAVGDILQSATLFNNKIYLVVNNSGKIEVINKNDFKMVQTITGLKSPRYLLPINANKAYVSDLYDNALSVVNLNNGVVESKINMPGWTEEMLLYQNKVYVTNITRPYLLSVNSANNLVEDTLACGYASNSIVKDNNNKIWVLSGGDKDKGFSAFLTCFDPINMEIVKQLKFANGAPKKLRINTQTNALYWININDVFTMHTTDTLLPEIAFIKGAARNFNGLAFNKLTQQIIVTDAKDYVQNGAVLFYNLQGDLIKEIAVGIIPNEICFLNN